VDEDLLVVSDRSVAFSGVFLAAVVEEASSDRLPDLREVFALDVGGGRHDGQLEPFHDHEQLLADVLGALDGARLDEVLVAPGVLVAVCLPRLVDGEEG